MDVPWVSFRLTQVEKARLNISTTHTHTYIHTYTHTVDGAHFIVPILTSSGGDNNKENVSM